jgi:16S rRNA (cytosine967-C5)-methyltransferase
MADLGSPSGRDPNVRVSGGVKRAPGGDPPNPAQPHAKRAGARRANRAGTRRVTPARACAYAVVRRVFEQGAWADRALQGEARRHGLDARDLALATQLSYGTVQRALTLDHVIEQLARRPAARLDAPVLAALRLGVYQLAFLDRVPAPAAVAESVELAKADAPRGAGLVNAVLRRAVNEARPLVEGLPEATPLQAALRYSYPDWIAALWWDAFGAGTARALMAACNQPAESAVRVNTLKAQTLELPVRTEPADNLPEALVLREPFDVFAAAEWAQGLLMPQSRAAMAVARALDPQPGERVLDLCAAPGGKTTHLAALMRNEGEIVAVEKHPGRADALRRTAERMGATIVTVRTADAAIRQEGTFDRVLVDPPCSDLGTLASRPDARWRKAGRLAALAELQAKILAAGASALKPGGTLVYSTCTISPIENERVVAGFLAAHDEFSAADLGSEWPVWKHPTMPLALQTLPHRDRTDGFFIARLRRG